MVRYPTDVSDCYLSPKDLFTLDNWTPQLTIPGFLGTAHVRISMVLLYLKGVLYKKKQKKISREVQGHPSEYTGRILQYAHSFEPTIVPHRVYT